MLSHVAIDRYTGGALQGALYNEEVLQPEQELTVDLYVEAAAFADHEFYNTTTNTTTTVKGDHVRQAFECALDDLCAGRLPLGGGTSRGHGTFSGTLQKPEA